jgi:hypothetical protein
MNNPIIALQTMIDATEKLYLLPHDEILQNGALIDQIRNAFNTHNIDGIINAARTALSEAMSQPAPSIGENALLNAYARREHKRIQNATAKDYITEIVNANDFETLKKKTMPEKASRKAEAAFSSVFNSVYSNGAVKINTASDPSTLMSYIDYSPYRVNYAEYLSVPTLSEMVDRPIAMAMKNPFEVKSDNEKFKETLKTVFQKVKLQSVIKDMLFNSVLSPRGSLLVPIMRAGSVSFNVFNDTQFAYGMGSSYSGITAPYDSVRVGDLYCFGAKLKHGVSAYFNCPGFEPLFGVGLNRVPQLRSAAEAWNLYVHILKILLVRAQVIFEKMEGDIHTDTMLSNMRAQLQRLSQSMGVSTPIATPKGTTIDILSNNISEGMSSVAPVIQSFTSSVTGCAPEYFFGGGSAAYNQAAFQISVTNENIRARYQIAQIDPMARFIINTLIRNDEVIKACGVKENDFDIHFDNIYDETDQERAELTEKRTETLIRQREYPELEKAFKHLKLMDEDVSFAGLGESTGGGARDEKEDEALTSVLTNPLMNAVTNAQEMDEQTKKTIRKLQSDLQRISNGERFFFNITQFQNLGLVKPRDIHYKDASGNDAIERTEWILTPKAKQYLNMIV